MSIFEASYDGVGFSKETFDKKFFVDNATSFVKDLMEQEDKEKISFVG
jgi:hypothetical protein